MSETPLEAPEGLDARGQRLWAETLAVRPHLGPGEKVLLEEGCRMADRLDRLDRVIRGEDFAEYMHEEDGPGFVLQVNAGLAEARLLETALRGVIVNLGLDATRAVRVSGPVTPQGPSTPEREGDPVDDIENARRRRQAGGAGA